MKEELKELLKAKEIIETHISEVYLTGEFAYKLKKPVDFGFLDFTTLEKRKFYVEEELRLNSRLSPDIYLEIIPIYKKENKLNLESGEIVDYILKMKELSQNNLMRYNINKITKETIKDLLNILITFYENAKTNCNIRFYGHPEMIKKTVDENFDQTKEFIGKAISKEDWESLREYQLNFLKKTKLFEKRIKQEKIKECHGDLHTGNIFIEPLRIFDCIEFNERFKNIDILSDLAFLSMDLTYLGKEELSTYLEEKVTKTKEEKELMKFYKNLRAYIRGKIGCLSNDFETAKKYFALAKKWQD